MTDISTKTNEELKEEIREQYKKELNAKADSIRLSHLRAEVEVEHLWDTYNPNTLSKKNLEKWLNELHGNHKLYLDCINKARIPSVYEQMDKDPDLYTKYHYFSYVDNDYIWKYKLTSKLEQEKKEDRQSKWLAAGIVIGGIVLFFGSIIAACIFIS